MNYDYLSNQSFDVLTDAEFDELESGPSDSRVLAAGLGYLYTSVSAPEHNAETQNLAHVYELVDGVIVDVWTIADKPVEVVSDGE